MMTDQTSEVPTKALVVYESMFGNTEQVAQAIAEGLATAMEVGVTDADNAPTQPAADVALLVVGGPTHAFSMTRRRTRDEAFGLGAANQPRSGIREWLGRLPRSDRGNLTVAVFDTRVGKARHLPGSAAKAAASVLKRHGYGDPHARVSFYVHDVPGPLGAGELDRARAWGEQLAADLAGVAP
jgi:hypothetical protein